MLVAVSAVVVSGELGIGVSPLPSADPPFGPNVRSTGFVLLPFLPLSCWTYPPADLMLLVVLRAAIGQMRDVFYLVCHDRNSKVILGMNCRRLGHRQRLRGLLVGLVAKYVPPTLAPPAGGCRNARKPYRQQTTAGRSRDSRLFASNYSGTNVQHMAAQRPRWVYRRPTIL